MLELYLMPLDSAKASKSLATLISQRYGAAQRFYYLLKQTQCMYLAPPKGCDPPVILGGSIAKYSISKSLILSVDAMSVDKAFEASFKK